MKNAMFLPGILAVAALLFSAESRVNFSGTWKEDVVQSTTDARRLGIEPAPLVIVQTDDQIELSTIYPDGTPVSEKYKFDGKEVIKGGGVQVSRFKMSGSTFEIIQENRIGPGIVTISRIYALSQDGKTLTSDTTISSKNGTTYIKYVFHKADPASKDEPVLKEVPGSDACPCFDLFPAEKEMYMVLFGNARMMEGMPLLHFVRNGGRLQVVCIGIV